MRGYIQGRDFVNDFQVQRYWSFPSSYMREKKQSELNAMLYSDKYVASQKMDGYFERVIKDEDGNIFMCSRNEGVDGVVEKSQWVPHLNNYFNSLPNGTCLLGEVYLINKTSKGITSILGCLKEKAILRQIKDEDKLRFYVFDILAWENKLLYNLPMEKRGEFLTTLWRAYPNTFVDYAEYWTTPNDIHDNWLKILANGGEGVVMTRKDYPYDFGKRTARKTLKLKKELEETIDVFLTGRHKEATYAYNGKDIENWEYWFDKLTGKRVFGKMSERVKVGDSLDAVNRLWYYGWAGAVEIGLMKDGKVTPIGWISGITDDIRQAVVEDNDSQKFRVAELQAMEIDRSGIMPTLRHAKIIRWRDDKNYDACGWNQII